MDSVIAFVAGCAFASTLALVATWVAVGKIREDVASIAQTLANMQWSGGCRYEAPEPAEDSEDWADAPPV